MPRLLVIWGSAVGQRAAEGRQWVNAALRHGAKLVVVDPRRIWCTKKADLWIKPRPCSDPALAMGLLKVIVDEKLYDADFVNKWTVGFDALCEELSHFTLDDVERVTWVPKAQIQQLARWSVELQPAVLPSGGNTWSQGARNFQGMRILDILKTITHAEMIPGWGETVTRAYPQISAGKMYLLDKFPRKLEGNVGAQYRYAVRSAMIPYQALTKGILDGKLKAAIFTQCDPLISYPNARKLHDALMQLDLMVVMNLFMVPTAGLADYVLPIATVNECDTLRCYTGGNPFQAQPKLIEPPGEAWSDIKVLNELAKKLGFGEHFFNSDEETLDYVLSASGVTWEEFKKIRVNRTKREKKAEEGGFFTTASGKAELYSQRAIDVYGEKPLPTWAEVTNFPQPTADYPLLVTSYCDEQYKLTGYKYVRYFRQRKPYPTVQLHPDVAEQIGAKDGDWVWIETAIGRIMQQLVIDSKLDPRVVMATFGWWLPEEPGNCCQYDKVNVNVLFDDQIADVATGSLDTRGFPCRVYKVTETALIPSSDKYFKEPETVKEAVAV